MKTVVFTDADLDGSMSYTMLNWCTRNQLPYIVTTVTKFHDDYIAWSRKNNPSEFDKIIILDLDISQQSLELVDRPNVYIVDHHKTHVENRDKYKLAKTTIEEYSSCAKLIYKIYKHKLDEILSPSQKKLLLLVDDYDSWTHRYTQSKQLNYIFWNYQGDRLSKFLKDFSSGFTNFTPTHNKIINFYESKLNRIISNLTYHHAEVSIQKQKCNCICTFASKMISDIGNHLIEDLKADIGFVVNTESNRVSIRKNKTSTVDVGKLAKMLIDGGGHDSASGGVCTEKFLEFSKLFSPVNYG